MGQLDIQLALHGVLILIVSMVSGRWFAKAIITHKNDVAWRVVHSGGSMSGIMLVAIAGILDLVILPPLLHELLVWLLIVGIWTFLIGIILQLLPGKEGWC